MITEQAKERCRILAFWEKHGTEATDEALKMYLAFEKVFEFFPFFNNGHLHIDNRGNDLDVELGKVMEYVGNSV